MVRRHGWQLPAHTLQVVAITVFFLLVIAFYVFLAPFLGTQIIEYASIAVYTAAAFAVFILYIRCTRINPADPGIMARFDSAIINQPEDNPGLRVNLPDTCDNDGIGMHSNSSSVSRSSLDGNSNQKVWTGEDGKVGVPIGAHKKSSSPCCILGGFIFALFVKEDCCNEQDMEQYIQSSEDDALFCTLCNAEVLKYSKHCRSCDKCVDGFDHHCRWLNNCVGRKNYKTFISLMTMSLIWLVIEFGVGVAVLVLCFVNKQDTENNIVKKLGNGFSRAPFAAVVAICTAVSLLACVPLGELLFFHIILIKKGITTYEYVVAMRAMSEAPPTSANEEGENVLYSPTNSATTGFSGGSSLGLPYKGVWCTPPRVFVDEDEVIPHLDPGRAPSTVDPDASGYAERGNKAKRAVKISAWKLAKLDSNEAMRAAAKARASSSVLRPVDARRITGADVSSTSNASVKLSPVPDSYPPSLGSKEDYEAGTHTASSFSSPGHTHEPVSLARLPDRSLGPRVPPPGAPLRNPTLQVASAGVTENTRASVVWDQGAGRYVSVLTSSRPHTNTEVPVRTSVVSSSSRPSNASVVTPIQQPERLMYTGQSIFFGGPLLNAPPRDGSRNEGSIGVTADAERETDVPHGVRGGRGRTADSFPVFTPGALQRNAPSNS